MVMPCSWPRDQSLVVVAIFSRKKYVGNQTWISVALGEAQKIC